MNTPTRVAAFALGLAAVFGVAAGVGILARPVVAAGTSSAAGPASGTGHETGADHPSSPSTVDPAANGQVPGGLMVSQGGYTLNLDRRQRAAAPAAPLRFRILGPDGKPVTRYTSRHGKDLHLIVVRRDLIDFQHVHPRLADDGTWSVPLDLAAAGVYRVFADFASADRKDNLVLGADLSVTGDYQPQPLPPASRTAVVDGYTVTLDGTLEAGQEAELTLSVSKDGQPVTDLQPYLEAYGHLVALRDRDLAYLHVHPAGSPGDGKTKPGPSITFYATAPSAGAYRLFLDFRHDDEVRTAGFTVDVGARHPAPGQATSGHTDATPQPAESEEGHGHGG